MRTLTLLIGFAWLAGCALMRDDADPHAGHRADPHAGHRTAPADPHAGHDMTVTLRPGAAAAVGIRTVPVREGVAVLTHRAPARVEWDAARTVQITAQPGGEIRSLAVPREGERVVRGQVVARLFQPNVLAAFEELHVAADLGEPWASAAVTRLRSLGVEEGEIGAARAAGRTPATYAVRAQAGGVVVLRPVQEGTWVAPGGVLAVLAGEGAVTVEMTVTSAFPTRDDEVTLRDPATSATWPARVHAVLPIAGPGGQVVRLTPTVPPPVGRPLVAEWTERTEEGLWVPRDAVVDTGERRVVFVEVGPDRFEPRPVVLGQRTAREIQILRGVVPGERVVAAGTFLLDSETQVGEMGHAGHGT